MKNFSLLICAAIFMTGCSSDKPTPTSKPASNKIDLSNAKDGTYTGKSSRDEKLGNSTLTLTIKDKKIVAAEFKGYDYGSLTGKDSAEYKKAPVAVNAIKVYPQQLVEMQDVSKVDAISGASISYWQFVETTKHAIEEASK